MTCPIEVTAYPREVRIVRLRPQVLTLLGVVRGPRGQAGAPGGGSVIRRAGGNLSGHRCVKAVSGGAVNYPAIAAPGDAVLLEGITTGAAAAGDDITVQIAGEMTEASWSWSLGPVFCGDAGVLTQAPPSSGWVRQIAVAVGPDTLLINLFPPILLA